MKFYVWVNIPLVLAWQNLLLTLPPDTDWPRQVWLHLPTAGANNEPHGPLAIWGGLMTLVPFHHGGGNLSSLEYILDVDLPFASTTIHILRQCLMFHRSKPYNISSDQAIISQQKKCSNCVMTMKFSGLATYSVIQKHLKWQSGAIPYWRESPTGSNALKAPGTMVHNAICALNQQSMRGLFLP